MNKYEIISTIGEGQYGVVLKAKNKQTSQLVAIKKFKEDDSNDQNKRVILRQVKILKTLNHQNIIQLKQAFRKKGKIYLVCEYVERNLLEILQQAPLSPQKVRSYTYQLLKGIIHMHSQNIIHRDIKPENVLISKSDNVKICDLGFARTIPSNNIMTDYVATRWYRPPQLLIGIDSYDKSIDIWAVGCLMAEMIDGQPLFGGQNDLDQLYLIQKCLGPLTAVHQQYFIKHPKFIGIKFPQIKALEPIERRYFGKIDKLGLDLLKKMLVMDSNGRITAQKALNHPYFQRVSAHSEYQMGKKSYAEIKSSVNEMRQQNYRGNLSINNFINEKQKSSKIDQHVGGINKVTGLSKGNKIQQNSSNDQLTCPWTFTGKSKSIKKNGTIIKEKNIPVIQEKVGKNLPKNAKVTQQQYDMDQHWQQQYKYEHVRADSKLKKQKIQDTEQKNKKKKWKFKKDNVNIIFNNNTYNLNIVQEPTLR